MEYRSELTQAEIDAIMVDYPYGRGWAPIVGYVATSSTPYYGVLNRATPTGPDEVYCGEYRTERDAWRACADTGRRMLEAWESGDTALMALMRASIRYAPKATDQQWADLLDFYRRIQEHVAVEGGHPGG